MQHLASWALESAFRSRWPTCERSPSGELGDPRASISSCVKRAQLVLPCGSWWEAGVALRAVESGHKAQQRSREAPVEGTALG